MGREGAPAWVRGRGRRGENWWEGRSGVMKSWEESKEGRGVRRESGEEKAEESKEVRRETSVKRRLRVNEREERLCAEREEDR